MERMPQHQEQLRQDEARYQRCDPMRAENRASDTIDFTPDGRNCLIDALGRASSVQGTLVLARNASVALSKDPDDQSLRAVALGAIDKARKILVSDKALYDRQEQVNQAYTNSLVMRLLLPPTPAPVSFATRALLPLSQVQVSDTLRRQGRRSPCPSPSLRNTCPLPF